MHTPTFSVLVPVFNARATLGEAIESVRAQTFDDWELVVVDDGSTDGSADVVAQHAEEDDRIRLVRRPNGGLSAARNTGIASARGRFCALLDADDVWLPEKLERQLPLLDDRTVVFSDAYAEDVETGKREPYGARLNRPTSSYPSGDAFDELLRQNFVPSLTAVVSLPLLRHARGFDEALSVSPDWDLWLRLALEGVRFEYAAEPLAVYRVHPESLSGDGEALRRDAVRVIRHARGRASAAQRTTVDRRLRVARRELEIYLRKRAWRAAATGNTRAAQRDLASSFRSNPRSRRAVVGVMLAAVPPLLRWFARRQPTTSFKGEFVRF